MLSLSSICEEAKAGKNISRIFYAKALFLFAKNGIRVLGWRISLVSSRMQHTWVEILTNFKMSYSNDVVSLKESLQILTQK